MTSPLPDAPARRRVGARPLTALATTLTGLVVGIVSSVGIVAVTPAPASAVGAAQAGDSSARTLYLVTLRHPGTAGRATGASRLVAQPRLLAGQQRLLDLVGAPTPVYRWTDALDGFAVVLTAGEAALLADQPGVALVERNAVRPLAALDPPTRAVPSGPTLHGPRHGGAGEVIGLVDTGIAPDSPLFAQLPSTSARRLPAGACDGGEDWSPADCNGKIVAAHWYVDGFGPDAVRSSATSLSAVDTDGHGTQMASIAAGNAGVPVRVSGEDLGVYGGLAPDAQIAVYKACWNAPEPGDDGCATADLVTAIDRATADGVDVLNLSVGGPDRIDTVERALLGATEAGVLVLAAGGNAGARGFAGHPGPWATTVEGATGTTWQGRVVVDHGPRLLGAMLSRRGLGRHRVVLASRVAARGSSRSQARVCAPGSLDASRAAGAVVVCDRGGVARVDKSQAVALADGVGMVVINRRRGSVDADVQQVPTVHLDAAAGRTLVRYVRAHRNASVRFRPAGSTHPHARAAPWSSPGDARGDVLKPDVLAPGTGLLGAVPGTPHDGWDVVSGSSAATAYASGVAATLLARTGWSAAEVRSALVTTARPVPGPLLRSGAGLLRPGSARRPGLAYLVAPRQYRAWLDGRRSSLDTPSIVLSGGATRARRTVTNVTGHRLYFSSSTQGFRSDVTVRPAALRLGPGESATFRFRVLGGPPAGRIDDGYVVWRGATGTVTRLPVAVSR